MSIHSYGLVSSIDPLLTYFLKKTNPKTAAITIRMIVLIGANEQCDSYPNILSLLAEESGNTVSTADAAEPMNPARTISSSRALPKRAMNLVNCPM
jgi:hypothetical protein